MLSARVGPTGSVLAIDLDTTLLEALADDRVEVRSQDLLRDPLPADSFDLVNARLLLMHLPARREAMRRLVAVARPGGWVAAIDPDFTTVEPAPRSLGWERTGSVFLDALVAGGWDPRYGSRLGADLRAAGRPMGWLMTQGVCAGLLGLWPYAPSAGWAAAALVYVGWVWIVIARMNSEQTARHAQREDPAKTISSQTTYVAHGRKP